MWSFEDGYLTSPIGVRWRSNSGPFGKGRLPDGSYTIGEMVAVNPPDFRKGAYRDAGGHAWFCKLTADFATERTGLGIHPDGASPGTEGCIGLTDFDTSGAYSRLRSSSGEKLLVR